MSPWVPVVQGLWIGSDGRPFREEFDCVLTVTPVQPPSDGGLRHRHIPAPAHLYELHPFLDGSIAWVVPKWQRGKKVLIQAQGWTWAEFVVAAMYVHLGAGADEALSSLRRIRPEALADPQYGDILRAREVGVA